jgi:competence protein CoiA
MTAQHAEADVLDATTDPLGGDLAWSAVHRARPRVPLTCRECGHGVHAKLSPKGLRFFAHDAVAPDCSLAGETIAHRLLKLQLASAIRDAGWFAELEVAGEGWRADVLATSPDGARQIAWEAQLAQITLDDLRERTARMAASGVPVCWVTDHDRPWIGAVPSIRLTVPVEPGETGSAQVVDGLGTFREHWCPGRRRCRDDPPGPCPGHGFWGHPAQVGLGAFVSGVLQDSVRAHQVPRWSPGSNTGGTGFVWTTRPHVIAERAQLVATAQRRERDELEAAERERHLAAIAAKLARQQALTQPSVELVGSEARGYVGVRDATLAWAMGVPLFVHDMPQGVISPVVSRITAEVRDRFRGLTLFVASETERQVLARACTDGQRIELFEVEIPARPRPPAVTYERAGRVR